MADISSITLPDGNNYDIKDNPSRETSLASLLFGRDGIPILGEKTYTNVIATANDNNGAGFFYLKVRPNYFTGNTTTVDSRELWHVKTRVISTVPGQSYYYTDTIFDIWGRESTYCVYSCANQIYSTSYRPIYYNSIFFTNSTGYTNNCGHWIGFNLIYSANPTSTSYKRTVTVQLLAYDNCEVELQDSLITPTNIPNRSAHTAWYASTDTSYTNFDACTNGLKQSGDANSTSIHALYRANGNYVANSALYRYQLLFQIDENQLTPLNNINNDTGTTKTMLTNVEFDPFGWIYYYATTTNVAAAGGISAGALYFHYSGVDLRYTFNCGTTLTAHKPFYLVVTPLSNGKCKLASSTPWTQTLPSTNDGKWYILLGRTYSTYQCTLYDYHPIYYYDGTSIKQALPVSTTNNYTFAEGTTNGAFSVTPSGGTAQSVTVHGLKALAYKDSLTASEVGALPSSTVIPTKTSDLTNDSGFITTETDPTVPSWAKASTKPSYTAAEVGALPDTTTIPSKVSDLTNDAGYITSAPVSSVDGKTGAVSVLPSGGSSNQVLAKSSGTNYAVKWDDSRTLSRIFYGTSTSVVTSPQEGDICLVYTA